MADDSSGGRIVDLRSDVEWASVIVGILSDTHDQVAMAAAAVSILRQAGAEVLIHCGDVGGPGVIDQLAGLRAILVWGNNDWDKRGLGRYAQSLGIEVFDPQAEVELAGKKIAVTHGDRPAVVQTLIEHQMPDYLFTGHTHVRHDRHQGRTRCINPGALHRAKEKTVATLDLARDELRFLALRE